MSDPHKIPPTLDEVREFFASMGSTVSAERFADYYESNGWKVGRVKMKNWHATARNWNRMALEKQQPKQEAKPLTEWEISKKQERLREIITRLRAYTNPGGSAWPVQLDERTAALVAGLQRQVEIIKKDLNS